MRGRPVCAEQELKQHIEQLVAWAEAASDELTVASGGQNYDDYDDYSRRKISSAYEDTYDDSDNETA
jgi:hypothetical protein